jgi:uncharacterized caspase-like protein
MRKSWIAVWLVALLAGVSSAQAGGRVALIIGNGAYRNVPKLENPAGDADAMVLLLKSVGFDVVEATDLTRDKLTERFLAFGKRAVGADLAVFYFAGQGISVDGANYALPVDADIRSVMDVKLGAAINIDDALDQTMSGAKVKLVFLDMSRMNPFAASISDGRPASMPPGLAGLQTAEGMLIAFACGPGQAAADGAKGGHSPFTQALLDHIAKPGVEIQQALTEVRAQVYEQTDKAQMPWGNSNLLSSVYLNPQSPAGKK